jgi:hypothetical protein
MFWDGKFTLRNVLLVILLFFALFVIVALASSVASSDDAPSPDQTMAPLYQGWDDVWEEEWEELEYTSTCEDVPWACQPPEPDPYTEPPPPEFDWSVCEDFWNNGGEWHEGC